LSGPPAASSEIPAAGPSGAGAAAPPAGAALALGLLFCINLLNYIDRYVLAGVLPLVEKEFTGITKERLGTLAPAFLVVYMLTSPLFGVLGDRGRRKIIVGIGVQLWSLATASVSLVRSFVQLFVSRMLVGVGEAAYGTIAPTILSDLYPKASRGRVLSLFYIAIPVGSALGYLLGGVLGTRFSWRTAFLLVGLPGLLVGLLAYWIREPERGASEGVEARELRSFLARGVRRADYLALLRNRSLVLNTLGMTAYTYAIGGLSFWMPTYLHQLRGLPLDVANFRFGLVTVGTGITGTLAGGLLADHLTRRGIGGAYFLVSGLGMLLAFPAFYLAVASPAPSVYWPALIVAELLLFLNTGPTNTIIVNVTLPSLRTTAMAANILVIHALGDVLSPVVMGAIADRRGLGPAFLSTSAVVVLGGLLWLAGTPFLGRDTARVVEQMRGPPGEVPGGPG
jgi:MFS transporter, Spinster family, sphingosine-1-phosphate transporter